MPPFVDDKSRIVLPFVLNSLAQHRRRSTQPFVVALNGVQGAGKTTLVAALQETLSSPPHSLPTIALSIDDLYLPRHHQQALAEAHPSNPLIQHRGQPGTHDSPLGRSLLQRLTKRLPNIAIPAYDKSAYGGKGDRVREDTWQIVNRYPPVKTPSASAPNSGSSSDSSRSIEVVLLEGWCVGFSSLHDKELESRWRAAKEAVESPAGSSSRLGRLRLEDVQWVNEALGDYGFMHKYFDVLVHIDAEDPLYVYDWRLEQEAQMRKDKGGGMSDEQVIEFVNGYYPSYELYTENLRAGIFYGNAIHRQLHLVVGKDRRVLRHEVI